MSRTIRRAARPVVMACVVALAAAYATSAPAQSREQLSPTCDDTNVCRLQYPGSVQLEAVAPRPTHADGVYVVTVRTSGHVRFSSPKVFHRAASDIRSWLTANGVRLIPDPVRGFIEHESPMSAKAMTAPARDAGAGSLLLVTVDRPMSQWITVTVQSYDLEGVLLWEEKVGSGTSPATGGSGYRRCFEKLRKALTARIGGPGLPIGASEESEESP